MRSQVVAEVVRSGFVEGRHHGAVVRVDPGGSVAWSVGDPEAPVFGRSCNKPMQATAMVRAGLPLRGRLLALASGSHSAEPFHLEAVREVLAAAGLDESALQTPPSYPPEGEARDAYLRSGGRPEAICMDCSGKHAGMLATCVANGWDSQTYLDPAHPLQEAIGETFVRLTGEPIAALGVDGCGAPLFATGLAGLARAFGTIVRADPDSAEGAVAAAITGWPEYVSGTTRDEARLIHAYPGAIAKSGAEACYAVAMPDGTAFAIKIDDGGARARSVVMSEALRIAGYD
ncbi:MAG: asparaginase, partial [Nocardioidaceae bacterium]